MSEVPLESLRPSLTHSLRELQRYRSLLLLWSLREIRVRYKQSLLGVAWAILQPLAMAGMLSLVFHFIMRVPNGDTPYLLFSFSAVLLWTFVSNGIQSGSNSLIGNMGLVGRIYFPREILPLAAVAGAAVDLAVASPVLILLLWLHAWPLRITILWLLPLVGLMILMTAGIALVGAATMVYFRDLRFVVPLGLQLWFYASPIVYPIDLIPSQLRVWYAINPMVGLVSGTRDALLMGVAPSAGSLVYSLIVSIATFILGFALFKRTERTFADVI